MIKADIRFPDGSVVRCVGRVRNKEVVPWKDRADLQDHIGYISSKGYNISIVGIFDEV